MAYWYIGHMWACLPFQKIAVQEMILRTVKQLFKLHMQSGESWLPTAVKFLLMNIRSVICFVYLSSYFFLLLLIILSGTFENLCSICTIQFFILFLLLLLLIVIVNSIIINCYYQYYYYYYYYYYYCYYSKARWWMFMSVNA